MSKTIKLKKGLNIKIKGKAELVLETVAAADVYALKPTDFKGLTPKPCVKSGQAVKAGEPLFYDKYNPEVFYVSPVGGNVLDVKRGERRRILEVIVQADASRGAVDFGKADPQKLSSDEVRKILLKSGMWPFIKRRPYGVVAYQHETPKSIFISGFDTAPLAPDCEFILNGQEKEFQTGVNALSRLTLGKIYLGLPVNTANNGYKKIENVEINYFDGPHPAGNVGVQIHHTDPINKGEVIWTINPLDVVFIGRLFETGNVDFSRIVALTGSEVEKPRYYRTILGARLDSILDGKLKTGKKQRIISGNPLTGTQTEIDSYLGFYDSQITVIPEGDEYDFMGWAMPGCSVYSASHTFLSSLFPQKEYELTANIHGGERAFIVTGQYEKVLPMDLYPVHLIKSIIANDVDKMEQLGIYEVVEEDMALCEFVCTSKIKVQEVLRKGINTMIKELG
ncbi:MAG: Na(+)-translocating NADH-quinone reductase subunit A [Prolixibacteraceae bacterium]|nr:Na(+)-translocating NADH-quinone reductase subunit A [Prolixibacteraceae bacterium]